jgi:phosphoglycolate phosphatase-like HAD superfamily hydrolase
MTIKLRPSISTLLFDWDGTIVDSAHVGLAAYQKTFAELDAAFSQEIYEATYSPNWYATYEALGLPKEKWSQADDLWQIHYDHQAARMIEGAADTLLTLRGRGYRLGVVTSGNQGRVTREVEQFGLADLFEVVICHVTSTLPAGSPIPKVWRSRWRDSAINPKGLLTSVTLLKIF